MKTREKAALVKLTRFQRFMDRHHRAVGALNQSGSRVALDELVRAMQGEAAAQRTAMDRGRSQTAPRRALRENLIQQLVPIIAIVRGSTEYASVFSGLRIRGLSGCDRALLRTASSVAIFAGEYRQIFLDECLPEDFVEQLVAATDAVRRALADQVASRGELTSATAAIAILTSRGCRVTRMLDALVLVRIRGNARLTAEWHAAIALKSRPST